MKKYKSFFILTILSALLLSIFAYLGADFMIRKNDGIFFKRDDLCIFVWLSQKEKINENLNKGKDTIVVLGGSSVLFGTNSDIISEITDKNVINLGAHAGVKDYIFIWAKKVLKKGNIVILPIEFGCVLDYNKICDFKANYILSNDKETYKNFDLLTRARYIGYFLTHSAICYNKNTKNEKIKEIKNNTQYKSVFEKMYDSKYWSNRGDVLNNFGQDEEKIKHTENAKCPVSNNIILTKDFLDFIKWCNENDIQVFVTYPVIFPFNNLDTKEAQDFLANYKKTFHKNNINFIGEAKDSYMELNDFLDGVDHLNQKGQRKRSIYLGNLIKAHLPQ